MKKVLITILTLISLSTFSQSNEDVKTKKIIRESINDIENLKEYIKWDTSQEDVTKWVGDSYITMLNDLIEKLLIIKENEKRKNKKRK